jgi:hypothetical protein
LIDLAINQSPDPSKSIDGNFNCAHIEKEFLILKTGGKGTKYAGV